jgi:hypothetical protein
MVFVVFPYFFLWDNLNDLLMEGHCEVHARAHKDKYFYLNSKRWHPTCTGDKTKQNEKKRRQQDSNLRRQSPTDFESVSLTTRTYRLCVLKSYQYRIYHIKFRWMVLNHPNKTVILIGVMCCLLLGQAMECISWLHDCISVRRGRWSPTI